MRIAGSAGFRALNKSLGNRGISREEVNDLLADLFLHLEANGWARLKSFRGATEPALRKFLCQMAWHLTRQRSEKERTAKRRERDAIQAAGQPTRDGPTEEQIANRYRELEARMPDRDREKLRCVSPFAAGASTASENPSAPAPSIPERTRQHWRTELLEIYADWV
jgi:hypothetical protein